ncbi:VOC family protein [Nocardia sp. NPDC052254]|uniref:VOC family protein n=1 Tax=Nocardia sp. NPDC052254 TaxID=3155681 RepID=UPI0034451DFB
MKILEVELTASNLDLVAEFYRDLLGLEVDSRAEGIAVEIGSSRLVVTEGPSFAGVHHLAFGISPRDVDLARQWLRQRVEPITLAGVDTFDGPPGWDSRSVYFEGPEGIVLELIARHADRSEPATAGDAPRLLSISEVGIGVPDVGSAVGRLADAFGLPRFPPQLSGFAPVGGHDGLLIVVESQRLWFPSGEDLPARGPVTVRIESAASGEVALTTVATVRAG